jgi:carbon monoxide dehydrogenase subunit G
MRRFLTIVVVLILILTAVAYLLPQMVTITRQTTIAAPPAKIFPLVNSLKTASTWSPWMAKDPAVTVSYDGPDAGVGARMAWTSTILGDGTQEITASTPDAAVDSTLIFGGMSPSSARFALTPEGDGTTVTWSITSDMGMNPIGRWMGLLMLDRWIGPDFETGLSNLKTLAENG